MKTCERFDYAVSRVSNFIQAGNHNAGVALAHSASLAYGPKMNEIVDLACMEVHEISVNNQPPMEVWTP